MVALGGSFINSFAVDIFPHASGKFCKFALGVLSYKIKINKGAPFLSAFLAEKWQTQNFGRELVFSVDLQYNGANEKPLPLGEVAAKPTERVKWSKNY